MQNVEDERSIRNYYADAQREWDRLSVGYYSRIEYDLVHGQLAPLLKHGDSVLDLGCGPGRHALPLANAGIRVALCDNSAACLASATQRLASAGLSRQLLWARCVAAQNLEPSGEQFDAVLMLGPLYHLLDADARARALSNAVSFLRPGGVLLAMFLTRYSVLKDLAKRGRFSEMQSLIEQGYLDSGNYRPLSAASADDYMPPSHTVRARDIEPLLQKAGLRDVELHSCEGFVAFMRPYLERSVTSEREFQELSTALRLTRSDPSLLDGSDHILAVARS